MHVADCIALDLRTDFLADSGINSLEQPKSGTALIWKAVLRDWQQYVAWLTKA